MANKIGDPSRAWWKESVVYQIYPRSFNDSDGDGVGDIPGVLEKVDYLADLGIDVVWLCPVYDSPNADNGYDIRDYRSIMAEFGDMGDWERLCSALHERGIDLIMDLVVNHTSDEHEWFQRSRREAEGYADFYHWVEGDPDEPPNNWESFFGGSAWSYDERREAWYLHLFDEKQPDLNWRNPEVREGIKSMVTWWLEKGIDGFRLDVINLLSKPDGYPDGDPEVSPTGFEHVNGGPRIHEYLGELSEVFGRYDVMTVGEMAGVSVDEAPDYVHPDEGSLNMIFQFDHMGVDHGERGMWDHEDFGEWELSELRRVMSEWQYGLQDAGWNALYLGNHDQPRIVSRFGDDENYRVESAKLLATFLLTLRGTPFVYQGEEIGMTNTDFESLEEVDDVMTIGPIQELIDEVIVDSYEDVRGLVNYRSRDHARLPMQWSADEHAGFTDGEPWIKINDNYEGVNVASALADADSVLHHYSDLIDLRHDQDVLVYGAYDLLIPEDDHFFAYTRTLRDERRLIVLNWSDEAATFEPPEVDAAADVLIGNYGDPPTDPIGASFRPYEAVVYRL